GSLAYEPWPTFDPVLVRDEVVTIGVQVNGKSRGAMSLAVDATLEVAKETALSDARIRSFVGGKAIKKVVYVPGKILNLIVA
ncbi:MAG: hypothetical protein WCI05_10585, partial [Myxococcales bacterium]